MAAYCYILECVDGTLYTGWTTDPARRLREHNAGYGARYTRGRRPVQLIYVEKCASSVEARKREVTIKSLRRSEKIKLIQSNINQISEEENGRQT